MNNIAFQNELLKCIRNAQDNANFWLRGGGNPYPENELKDRLEHEFNRLNRRLTQSAVVVDSIRLKEDRVSDDHWNHTAARMTGGAVWALGQPVLKKRFVLPGSAPGTSIASKYLSRAFPQKLPVRILKTNVLGRVIGRAFPAVGGTIIAIDVIETLLVKSADGGSRYMADGGDFGGAGAIGSW